MSDYDRDREPERVRETDRTTTVVHTDGGGRRGGGGILVAILLIVALLALLFFLFGGNMNRAADEVGVNVDVDAPKVEVPEVKIPDVEVKVPEKIEVDVPEVRTEGDGNAAR